LQTTVDFFVTILTSVPRITGTRVGPDGIGAVPVDAGMIFLAFVDIVAFNLSVASESNVAVAVPFEVLHIAMGVRDAVDIPAGHLATGATAFLTAVVVNPSCIRSVILAVVCAAALSRQDTTESITDISAIAFATLQTGQVACGC
jgi:hypothetical protein